MNTPTTLQNDNAEEAYIAFIDAIDNSVAGVDQHGDTLRDCIDCSAHGNAWNHYSSETDGLDYWEMALATAQMILDEWPDYYPELIKRERQ